MAGRMPSKTRLDRAIKYGNSILKFISKGVVGALVPNKYERLAKEVLDVLKATRAAL